MQKLQDSVFTIVKTTNLSPAVFSFLQPSDEFGDKTPLGGILKDTKYGWLALGPKFCVVDLRTGLKVAARTFGASLSNNTTVTCVVELPTPLTENSQQLIISLQCDDIGMICILHINGSQILRCMQTDVIVTELAVCDRIPDGPFMCFDGLVMAGTKRGEIFVFDLNRAILIQALKDISKGYEHLIQNEANPTSLSFLPLNAMQRIEEQRALALENDHHLAILLNENSMVEGQYIFRNPDGTVRMKAKRDHIRVTVLEYIPQLGSMAVGFNFGAFQLWNLITLDLEFTSQVNVECLPVTHFGFQEPCDDPRAFCYLWVIFSVIDRYEDEEFPLAVMYSLTYQGKRMLSDTKCLYQDFSTATIRFQVELGTLEEAALLGGKCISCHSYSIKSTLGDEGEDSMLNICQLVWECWGEDTNSPMQYGMLLFDLDQWYKDQMPATYRLESSPFMSATWCTELAARGSVTLHARLDPASVCAYSHATRLEEHFYPNSLQYDCICLNTSEALTLRTVGIQRQIVAALEAAGGAALLHPAGLHAAASRAGLAPHVSPRALPSAEDQRRYLLSVALEARLSRFLKRCAHDWATGSHSGVGCTLPFLVDWAWKRAVELKENAKELTAPLFISSALPDRNVVRCLEHCVQQLTQLTDLMDAILTKCCNLVVPDALSEMEERHVGIGCVSLYFQVVQWLLRVGLLPERGDGYQALPYPGDHLQDTYNKRRMKLNRLQDTSNMSNTEENANQSCSLLYIDQLIENEFGGERVHQMWVKGGSECGLYPPPSLYALLRLYLLPDIAEEHKHSLVLYLLVDYSMVYDDGRYEAVIRRLMQFPTMFGLSNTAIKATQAFWHLDHRDFDFALDQLQCLTGNTLHEWQHNVVLSSLLAQKKTQAALQYLHVRKPAPIQNIKDGDAVLNYSHRLSDHDKLEDWQSCCNLYLARGLVFEALDVVRMCAQHAASLADKAHVMTFFFKGCRNTGNLSKILQVSLLPFEEEVFIKYLENCNESQTSDLLIMYYLQQARYLEAERYNNKLKQSKPQRNKEISTSVESLFEVAEREGARDALVEVVCAALPNIAGTVAHCALDWRDLQSHVNAPKPMSVFVQAKSPKNTFTYKSSFIQDTIENASETWMNKPKMRKGLKRALNIEETPFICTPKLLRTRSVFTEQLQSDSTPPKRARLNLTGTPKTPKMSTSFRVSEKLSSQMEQLLDMPEAQSPVARYQERAETPHSILKIRRNEREEAPSPVDSRYLGDSDDELLETASSHTHYSDSTNKHLRFTIPTASESGSTPSPVPVTSHRERAPSREKETTLSSSAIEKETDISMDSFVTTASHAIHENHPMESPPKKKATESSFQSRRSYKDTVRARLSLSANSSLSEDPNTSIESIADIPITLINPRYSGERMTSAQREENEASSDSNMEQTSFSAQNIQRNLNQPSFTIMDDDSNILQENTQRVPRITIQDDFLSERKREEITLIEEKREERLEVPRTPRGRRGIRSIGGESTPLVSRSRSGTPERQDSPVATPLRVSRLSRSRSKTPELSPRSSPLAPIPEQPKQEVESEPHQEKTTLSVPRQNLRSKSRTPERMVRESPKLEVIKESPTKSSNSDTSTSSSSRRSLRSKSLTPERMISESPNLEVITESPTKSSNTDSASSSPSRRSLRSRSRTPEVEIVAEPIKSSPRTLRSRSKTPEKLMSPKKEHSVRTKKSLSRIVLEANTFAKTKQTLETLETEITESRKESIECTPMKPSKQVPSLMDVTLSPIVNKSVLQSSDDSALSATVAKDDKSGANTSELGLKPLPAFTTLHETYFEKSVLRSYQSSFADMSDINLKDRDTQMDKTADSGNLKPLPAFTTINETDFNRSVLHSYESSVAETSQTPESKTPQKEKQVELPKPFAAFASMIETDFERSVLHSHQSSVAESSEMSNVNANVSSLITDDSDVEMKGDQDRAEQKEKKQIVEIEREIHEIEGDMSNDSVRSGRSDTSEEDDETSSGEQEESDSSDEISTDSDEDEDEVISVDDSDIESETPDIESDTNPLQIVEVEEIESPAESKLSEKPPVSDPLKQKEKPELSEKQSISEPPKQKRERAEIAPISDILDKNDSLIIAEESSVSDPNQKETAPLEKPTIQIESEFFEIDPSASTDPLNQSQVSLMTDDNSVLESDQSLSLIYPDDMMEKNVVEDKEKSKEQEAPTEVEMKIIVEEVSSKSETVIEEPKPAPASMDVVDTSASETEIKEAVQSGVTKDSEKEVKSNEKLHAKEKSLEIETIEVAIKSEKIRTDTKKSNIENTDQKATESRKEIEKTSQSEEKSVEPEKPATSTRKRVKSTASNKSSKETEPEIEKASTVSKELKELKVDEPKTPVTRKRANSNASAKSKDVSEAPKDSTKETESTKLLTKAQDIEEPQTPATRKRTKSNASKPEEKTPEEKTPSRRPKTPTSAETRKIITRRISREMAGKLDESSQSLDESVSLTPSRRATRSKSKNFDDNESVASESSVVSNKSRVSEDTERKPVRKGRKSVVATKPDLSVIPELIAEEGKEDAIAEYSGSRRLTRGQRGLLSSWLAPRSPARSSLGSEPEEPRASPFDVQPIDRISLLNKTHFEGPPDSDELQMDNSPESIASDASKMRRSRLGRATSEARATPKAAKIGRRAASIDVVQTSEIVSPATSVDSPARSRRASFNRACEALHTPKGRRNSTEARKSVDSPVASPAASEGEAPRRASTASLNKTDGKRSIIMPVLEED